MTLTRDRKMSNRWFESRYLFNWLHTCLQGSCLGKGRLATEPGVADNRCIWCVFFSCGLIIAVSPAFGKIPKIPEWEKFTVFFLSTSAKNLNTYSKRDEREGSKET